MAHHGCKSHIAILCWSRIKPPLLEKYLAVCVFLLNNSLPVFVKIWIAFKMMAKRIVKGEHSHWPCIMCQALKASWYCSWEEFWKIFFFAKTAAVILTAVPSATLQHLQPRGNPISPALVSWGLKRPWHAFAAFRDPCLLWENKPELTWWRMGDCVEQKWAISAPGALDWPSTWPQTHE